MNNYNQGMNQNNQNYNNMNGYYQSSTSNNNYDQTNSKTNKSNKKITLITNKYNNDDYIKYKQEYHNITLKINNSIHDRFIIIDKRLLYNCGASFKDLGKKCFALNKIIDTDILNNLLKKINS